MSESCPGACKYFYGGRWDCVVLPSYEVCRRTYQYSYFDPCRSCGGGEICDPNICDPYSGFVKDSPVKTFTSVDDLFAHSKSQSHIVNLVGMIKESDRDGVILYTPAGCESWIEISKEAIVSISYISEAPCHKPGEEPHTHPYVDMTISLEKHPGADYLRAISSMLRRRSVSSATMITSSTSRNPNQLKYFGSPGTFRPHHPTGIRPLSGECGDMGCYYVGSQCPYGCACIGDDGMGFCSSCCIG